MRTFLFAEALHNNNMFLLSFSFGNAAGTFNNTEKEYYN